MILQVLGVLAVVGIAGFLTWNRYDMAKASIEGELLRRKAADIKVRPNWLDFDRDTLTCDVEYTAADGSRKANTCKVSLRAGADDRLFWASPL